eukprot:scaffold12131_cov112-Isochrysis_galbana.AAC.9
MWEIRGHKERLCFKFYTRYTSIIVNGNSRKKPILAFLATGQHGAAELRVGPDGRLPGRAAVTSRHQNGRAKTSSQRCAERHNPGPGRGRTAMTPSTYALLWSH